jgi:hypothetical protein
MLGNAVLYPVILYRRVTQVAITKYNFFSLLTPVAKER